jgi:large subunit ribosomal protein L9
MRVILLQDIRGIGKKYEVKDVAEGFGKNYLLPRKLVLPATPGNLAQLAAAQARRAHEEHEAICRLAALRDRLGELRLTFPVRADEHGAVYGSVTKESIMKAMREHGWLGPERIDVELQHPLKNLGEHRVRLDLKNGMTAELTVILERS